MANGFNGTYTIDKNEKLELSEAHLEALELLSIVHDICKKKSLKYTLIGMSLFCSVFNKSFSEIKPEISVLISYNEYLTLKKELIEYISIYKGKYTYSDSSNTDQFDTIAFCFAKKNRVELPEARKKDEIYYYTQLKIIPAFGAGNTKAQFKKIRNKYIYVVRSLNARAPFPQHKLRTQIRIVKRLIINKYYRSKRDSIDIHKIENELSNMYNSENSKYYLAVDVKSEIYRCELDEVIEVDFMDTKCFVSKYAEDIINRAYSKKDIEELLKKRISDLVSKGGETLRRVQQVQTEMLVEFDRVCRKNDICYHIAFGTLLGAVRHGGFIPWDDDVDVILPYEEYLKLDEAMKKDLDTERFFWRTIDTEKDFNLTFKHLKRNGTVYKKPGRDKFNFHKGVLIDVFPVFPSANNRITHWIQTELCVFWRRVVWAYMGVDTVKNPFMKWLYKKLNKRGVKKNHETFSKCALMYKKKNQYYSYYNANFRSPYHTYFLSEEAFNDTVEYEFEGHKFLGPKDYNTTLSYCFTTDYMLLPKIEDRKPSHFAVIDLGDLFSY